MIIGKLKDLRNYLGLSVNIDEAIRYTLNTDLLNLEIGKYVLNDNLTVNRQQYFGKEVATAESHIKYIDLQIVLKGNEKMGYADIFNSSVSVKDAYNEEIDLTLYDVVDECVYEMSESSFALIFPEDIHRPGMKVNEELIEKVVIKIRVN